MELNLRVLNLCVRHRLRFIIQKSRLTILSILHVKSDRRTTPDQHKPYPLMKGKGSVKMNFKLVILREKFTYSSPQNACYREDFMGLGSLKLLQFAFFLFLKSITVQRNLVMHIFPK